MVRLAMLMWSVVYNEELPALPALSRHLTKLSSTKKELIGHF
jgi:hypothetical protein